MSFFRTLQSFTRMFQRLFGMLVSALMIFFPVAHGSSTVRVCGEFMKFGSSLMRVLWHGSSILSGHFSLELFYFLDYTILNTHAEVIGPRAFEKLMNSDH